MDRDIITSKIKNITNVLEKNGFITASTNRIVHFAKHIDIVPDEEFDSTVQLWIKCIQSCIIKIEASDAFLKVIAKNESSCEWITDYLYVKTISDQCLKTSSDQCLKTSSDQCMGTISDQCMK